VNVETKKAAKEMNAHIFTEQAEKAQTNAVCQKADGNCFL
jgi:hypothetical protein